jgi:hypothetical protein
VIQVAVSPNTKVTVPVLDAAATLHSLTTALIDFGALWARICAAWVLAARLHRSGALVLRPMSMVLMRPEMREAFDVADIDSEAARYQLLCRSRMRMHDCSTLQEHPREAYRLTNTEKPDIGIARLTRVPEACK